MKTKTYSKHRFAALMAVATALAIAGGMSTSIAQDPPPPPEPDPLLEEVPPEMPAMPGCVEGSGTSFEITDSDYLNITLQSSEPVQVRLESAAELVVMHIEATTDTLGTATTLTFSGLAPATTYYKYQDGYRNLETLTTDAAGCCSYAQDLSERHLVILQTKPSTIFIPSDTSVGTWNANSRKYTLNTDVFESIEIEEDNLVLEGAGHIVNPGSSGIAVSLQGRTGVTVQNVTVSGGSYGVWLEGGSGNTITKNTVPEGSTHYGIRGENSSGNLIEDNTLLSRSQGIYLRYSDSNSLSRNSMTHEEGSRGAGIYLRQSHSNTLDGNVFRFAGGTTRAGGTIDVNGDNNSVTGNDISDNLSLGDQGGIRVSGNGNLVADNTVSNRGSYGISIGGAAGGSFITPTNNTVSGCQRPLILTVPAGSGTSPEVDTSNTADGRPIYIVRNTTAGVFNDPDAACLIAVDCSEITVDGLQPSQSPGVEFLRTSNSTIQNVVAAGILLRHSAGNLLLDNTSSGSSSWGFHIAGSADCTLQGNTASENWGGFVVSQGCILEGNTSSNNETWGFRVHSTDCELNNNIASNNMYGIETRGLSVLTGNRMESNQFGFIHDPGYRLETTVDVSNTIDGRPIYYLNGVSNAIYDSSIVPNPACFVALNCNNITIRDLHFANNSHGIVLHNTSDSTIENVTTEGNLEWGIYLRESPNCRIDTVVAVDNGHYSSEGGIALHSSDGTIVTGSIVSNNKAYGILDDSGVGNLIDGNGVSGPSYCGIAGRGGQLVVVNNTVSNCDYGISLFGCDSSQVYNNNFNNNARTEQNFCSVLFNLATPVGGNFWSDKTGPDANGDWFVDEPYVIDGNWYTDPLYDNLPWTIPDGWKATPTSTAPNSGQPVTVQPVDPNTGTTVELTFDDVTGAGETMVTTSELEGVMDPPEGYRVGDSNTIFFISTTASYNGLITIAVPYTTEPDPALFHYVDGAWVDVTTSIDTVNQIIYGEVSSLSPFAVFVPNTAPQVTITAPESGALIPIDGTLVLEALITDPDPGDAHAGVWTISNPGWTTDLEVAATVTGTSVCDAVAFPETGIYSIALTVVDSGGATATADTVGSSGLPAYVVVFDPDGSVTGGGWILSPPGALPGDGTAEGKANFGFVSEYKKGATVPTGQTEFQFKAGDLNFHSAQYDWLVVAGARAQYKGSGTVNGDPRYRFMLTAIDGDLLGGSQPDRFRIKIWDAETDAMVYDNQVGTDDNSDLSTDGTLVRGGSIVVHKK